jgi:hypothetical protein
MQYRPFCNPRWRALALATLTTLSCGAALAQWQWIDASGRKVFSDTAPPAGIPDKSILKRPGFQPDKAPAPAPEAEAANLAKPATAPMPKLSGRDESLEAKKKLAEEAEKAKKKADQEKLAKDRAENCARAKQAKVTLDSGIRIATTNAKGEREIMDDKARASEAQRLNEIIRSDCGALPPPPAS